MLVCCFHQCIAWPRCGAPPAHLSPGHRPAVSLLQDRVRVATSTFRRGGVLCSLCAVSPRVNQHKLGGKRIVSMVVPAGPQHLEEAWNVAPGLLEDPGHSFLAPILLPEAATGQQVLQHRERLRELVAESRELEEVKEVREFVPAVSEEQAVREEREEVEALWGEEGEDEALLAACLDGNGNTVEGKGGKEGAGASPGPGSPYCRKCKEEGHATRYCPGNTGGEEEGEEEEVEEGEGEHWTKRWGEGREEEKAGGKRMREQGGEDIYGCFKCGETGHYSRECPKRKAARAPYCYRCKEAGHWNSKCPNQKLICRKCNEEGHAARHCSRRGDVCYSCGEEGHRRAECPQGRAPKAGRYGAVVEGGQLTTSRRGGGSGGRGGGSGGKGVGGGGSSLKA